MPESEKPWSGPLEVTGPAAWSPWLRGFDAELTHTPPK